MNGWVVFALLVAAYLGLYLVLRGRKGPLPGGFEFAGPLLLWRTQWGKRAIERVARPTRFWNAIADVGIVLTWFLGIAIFLLLILSLVTWVLRPQESAETAPGVRELLGLPGINPMIPLGYGIAALILALVIHEGSHGVMAYVARMRVKSLGLVMLIVPVGAFVEPNDEDMMRATTRQKNRVFAAGPTSNIVLAVVAGVLLSTLFVGQMEMQQQGILVGNVVPGEAAELAGLKEADVIVRLGEHAVMDRASFTGTLANMSAGDRITIAYVRDGQPATTEAVLGDQYEYYQRTFPELEGQPNGFNESVKGRAFLGVAPFPLSGGELPGGSLDRMRHSIAAPFSSLGAFFFYISYPFFIFTQGIDVLADPYHDLFVVTGPLAALPDWLFFGAASLLYWIMWLNLMLGTFNALPAGPLDGGQMLRATLSERMMRRYKVDRERLEVERSEMGGLTLRGKDEETQAKLDRVNIAVSRATRTLGFFILGLILLPVFAPPLVRLLL